MKIAIPAALALTAILSPRLEGAPVPTDLSYSMPVTGNWTYAPTSEGSAASFTDSSGKSQLTIHCTRSSRRVKILKTATAASPLLWIWTSSQNKSLPASYDASGGRIVADVSAYDPILDAIASSRGRIGFSASGVGALVVPPWADVGRVVEDCRA
jgi:hypothetical protein